MEVSMLPEPARSCGPAGGDTGLASLAFQVYADIDGCPLARRALHVAERWQCSRISAVRAPDGALQAEREWQRHEVDSWPRPPCLGRYPFRQQQERSAQWWRICRRRRRFDQAWSAASAGAAARACVGRPLQRGWSRVVLAAAWCDGTEAAEPRRRPARGSPGGARRCGYAARHGGGPGAAARRTRAVLREPRAPRP